MPSGSKGVTVCNKVKKLEMRLWHFAARGCDGQGRQAWVPPEAIALFGVVMVAVAVGFRGAVKNEVVAGQVANDSSEPAAAARFFKGFDG